MDAGAADIHFVIFLILFRFMIPVKTCNIYKHCFYAQKLTLMYVNADQSHKKNSERIEI